MKKTKIIVVFLLVVFGITLLVYNLYARQLLIRDLPILLGAGWSKPEPDKNRYANSLVIVVDPGCEHCRKAVGDLAQISFNLQRTNLILISINDKSTGYGFSELIKAGKLDRFTFLNDRHKIWFAQLGYPSTPSYFFYRNGKLETRITGYRGKEAILQMIQHEKK
ncbi:thioredoxin family protein [Flavihumibacter sp. UBA7668]|uniref:thioredoxin family protein n=1 Tax=Flavihumibacter sp. UBA7668 TaxID=1946542 RepID=UPI0025C1DA39|nr:thioredoxin family protein [Flavihumibacter sp. UBA7668]